MNNDYLDDAFYGPLEAWQECRRRVELLFSEKDERIKLLEANIRLRDKVISTLNEGREGNVIQRE